MSVNNCSFITLTPPDTLSRPIWDLNNYVLLVKTNPFPELVVIFPGLFTSNIPRYFLDFAYLTVTTKLHLWIVLDVFIWSPGSAPCLNFHIFKLVSHGLLTFQLDCLSVILRLYFGKENIRMTHFLSYTGKCATCVKHAFLKTHVKRTFNAW